MSAKLTSDQVKAIIELRSTHTYQEIANLFGLCQSHVFRLVKRQAWKHLTSGPCSPPQSERLGP